MAATSPEITSKKTWKRGSSRMRKYTLFREIGFPIQEAYKLAGYKGLASTKAAYRAEERRRNRDDMDVCPHALAKITNRDLLTLGIIGAKRLFEDFLAGRGNVKASTIVKLIQMQQDRIDPKPRKNRHGRPVTAFTQDEIVRLNAEYDKDFEKVMKSAEAWGNAAQVIAAEPLS